MCKNDANVTYLPVDVQYRRKVDGIYRRNKVDGAASSLRRRMRSYKWSKWGRLGIYGLVNDNASVTCFRTASLSPYLKIKNKNSTN